MAPRASGSDAWSAVAVRPERFDSGQHSQVAGAGIADVWLIHQPERELAELSRGVNLVDVTGRSRVRDHLHDGPFRAYSGNAQGRCDVHIRREQRYRMTSRAFV